MNAAAGSRPTPRRRPPAKRPARRSSTRPAGQGSGRGGGRGGRGRKGRGRARRPWWLRLLLWGTAAVATLTLLGAAFLFWSYQTTDIPDPNEFADSQSSIVYFEDGQTELARFTGGYNRESVPLSQVPTHVREAMLAAEDRDFYSNPGISLTGMTRALWTNLTSGEVRGGGSTITQQYVKNYFLSHDQTLSRKFDEVMIAVKIDRQLSKDEILENYLNTIYYGRGAYGIQTAAQAYFGKDVSELDVAEGAFLASVTNAPSLFDPAAGSGNADRAQERVSYVLDGMVSEGWLDAQTAADAAFPDVQDPDPATATTGPEGYIAAEVRRELIDRFDIAEADIERGGLRVVTTIDPVHQQAALDAVAEMVPESGGDEDFHLGLVSVRPGDGAITALYGGDDFRERQLNNATDARLQAGSLMKAFTLVGALEQGISTETRFAGPSPMTFEIPGAAEPYEVRNFGNEPYPEMDLRAHTANSVNTSFVQLNERISPEATRAAAIQAGLPQDTPGLTADLSNVLGPAAPTVQEMAGAYATLAAQGEYAQPYLVASVSSSAGNYSEEAEPQPDRRIDADVTADVTEALTQVITEGTGRRVGELGRPAAGKTGTSEDNKSAWFSGYVPQLSVTVGLYAGDGTVAMQQMGGFEQITGGTIPASVWGEFMRGALEGEPVQEFPPRAGIGDTALVTPTPTTTTAPPATETATDPEPTSTPTEPTETTPPEPTETTTPPEPTETTPPEPTDPPTTTTPPAPTDPPTDPPTTTTPPAPTDPPTTTTPPAPTDPPTDPPTTTTPPEPGDPGEDEQDPGDGGSAGSGG